MKTINLRTRLEDLPSYLQKPLWKQYKGTNYSVFAESSMKKLIAHGYIKVQTYIGRKIR